VSIGQIFSGTIINLQKDSIAEAIAKKSGNESVSKTTLGKLNTLASSLYAIGNTPGMGSRLAGLVEAKKDIAAAAKIVSGMDESSAKTKLGMFLTNIQSRVNQRHEQIVNHFDTARAKHGVYDLENNASAKLMFGANGTPTDMLTYQRR
jgi:hypothetical protein